MFRTLALCLLALLVATPVAAQSRRFAPTCPFTDGEYHNANLRRVVDEEAEELRLIDDTTGEIVHVLETGVKPARISGSGGYYWSTSCHYIWAIDRWHDVPDSPVTQRWSAAYDTVTGRRVAEWGRDPFFAVRSSPTNQHFVLKTTSGTLYITHGMDEAVLLFRHYILGRSMRYRDWDYDRNELMVNFFGNSGFIDVFDMSTGARKDAISLPEGCNNGLRFSETSIDNTILVYTDPRRSSPQSCIGRYHRDTHEMVAVNSETLSANYTDQIALSPDGRYIVSGMRALRVWDLTALPENIEDRLPTYRHEGPVEEIRGLSFVDSQIVEVSTGSSENLTVSRWNIIDGQPVE